MTKLDLQLHEMPPEVADFVRRFHGSDADLAHVQSQAEEVMARFSNLTVDVSREDGGHISIGVSGAF